MVVFFLIDLSLYFFFIFCFAYLVVWHGEIILLVGMEVATRNCSGSADANIKLVFFRSVLRHLVFVGTNTLKVLSL